MDIIYDLPYSISNTIKFNNIKYLDTPEVKTLLTKWELTLWNGNDDTYFRNLQRYFKKLLVSKYNKWCTSFSPVIEETQNNTMVKSNRVSMNNISKMGNNYLSWEPPSRALLKVLNFKITLQVREDTRYRLDESFAETKRCLIYVYPHFQKKIILHYFRSFIFKLHFIC